MKIMKRIGSKNVQQSNGLSFTDFNRTISDFLANESLLAM